jgi:hypothetical protein
MSSSPSLITNIVIKDEIKQQLTTTSSLDEKSPTAANDVAKHAHFSNSNLG